MKVIPQLSAADEKRFWSNVNKECDRHPALENPDLYSHVVGNCWEWTGPVDRDGYGMISLTGLERNKRSFRATRVAYTIQKNEDPGSLLVCHHCDNPSCIRGDHLYAGSVKQNAKDMVDRGRAYKGTLPCGEDHPDAKHTEEQVRSFFDDYNNTDMTVSELATKYDFGEEYAYAILAGNKWGYLGLHNTRIKRVRSLEEDVIKEVYYRYWTEPVSQADLAKEYDMDQTHVGQITRQFIWKEITDQVELPFKLEKRNGKLLDHEVIDIFTRYRRREATKKQLAKEYNVSISTIYQIGAQKTKKAITQSIAI